MRAWGSGSSTRTVGGAEARRGGSGGLSRRPLGWVADAFPAPALAPAARGRSVEGDPGRNEVPFNLGALGELLTCHWHPLILKRRNTASQATPRRERWGRGRPHSAPPRSAPRSGFQAPLAPP